MFENIRIKKIVVIGALIFVFMLFAGNSPREAYAFSVQPDGVSSGFSKYSQDSPESLVPFLLYFPSADSQPHQRHRSEKENDGSYQNSQQSDSLSHFDHDSIFGKESSHFNLIKGDFCLTGLDQNEWFSHFPFNKDDIGQDFSPSPVPLSATALFFGTGMMILAGLTYRLRIVN